MKKKLLFIIFAALLFNVIEAQRAAPDAINFKKYWWYHYRLLNDFLVKGDCQGCSEPMNQRDYQTVDGVFPSRKMAKWGDQTISLGMYIAVLATEYRLLKDNHQPTDTTVQELYYALKAFNRLDENAEEFYSSPGTHPASPADLNGFFMRDDVDTSFIREHPQIRYGKIATREVTNVNADYGALNPRINEMSHDQVWHMFMGLALVSALVDHGENYNGMPLNDLNYHSDINQEAKDIADRIMNCIRSNNWVIKNPVTGLNVFRGPDVWELSYGAAEAGCFIRNENTNPSFFPPIEPVHSCGTYHDGISYFDAIPWNELGKPLGGVYIVTDEDYKPEVLAAIGKSWWSSMYAFVPNPMAIVASLLDPYTWAHPLEFLAGIATGVLSYPANVTMIELGHRAIARDWQHLPLLLQVLHGGGNLVPPYVYFNILDTAPCNGPYNFGYPANSSSFEWSTDNRMLSPDRRGEYGSAMPDVYADPPFNHHLIHAGHSAGQDKIDGQNGEFNGLDYMLYYNLFTLSHGSAAGAFYDYMDRRITIPYPFGLIGAYPSHPVIEGFHSIDASNIINNNATIDYRAGEEIHLGDGFHAIAGCDFHAYIDPFECSGGDYRMATTSNDSSNDNGMSNAVAYAGQTTFVNYPSKPKTNNNVSETQNNIPQYTEPTASAPLSPVVAVKKSGISIQPNPTTGSFTVVINDEERINAKLTLFTIFGKVIFQQSISNPSTIIDISGEAKGIYYVKVENAGKISVEKVVYQ